MNSQKESDLKTYKAFRKGIIKLGYNIEEVETWHYAGGFCAGDISSNESRKIEDFRLRKLWEYVMGNNIDIPDEDPQSFCPCETEIVYNHIIVNDPNGEEPEYIIIGSECAKRFSNNNDGLKGKRKCIKCGEFHRNKKTRFERNILEYNLLKAYFKKKLY